MGLGLDAHSVKVPIRSIVEGAPLRNTIFYTLGGNIDGGLSFSESLDGHNTMSPRGFRIP